MYPTIIEIIVGITQPNPILAKGIKLKFIPGIANRIPKTNEV